MEQPRLQLPFFNALMPIKKNPVSFLNSCAVSCACYLITRHICSVCIQDFNELKLDGHNFTDKHL